MAIHALVTGTLWKDPEQRTSKTSGKNFTMATLRIKDGADDMTWIKVLAFGTDAQAELARLGDGEAVSVQGTLKADFYAPPDREPRVNLTVFADIVVPLRAPPKAKKPKDGATAQGGARAGHSTPETRGAAATWGDPWPANMEARG